MPSQRHFYDCPPFPTDVPVADLPTISFRRLENGDAQAAATLFDACRQCGFFILALQDSSTGNSLIEDAERMFDMGIETLNLDPSILAGYAYTPPDIIGYKPAGMMKVGDDQMDCTELYNVGQADILGVGSSRTHPQPIERRRGECRAFCTHANAVVTIILQVLEDKLGLPLDSLAKVSRLDVNSGTSFRMLLTRPEKHPGPNRITLGQHTDVDVVTLLFNIAGGLQILPPGSENVDANWRYVQPRPKCVIVNLGDAISVWTRGMLRSAWHRMVTAPGMQNAVTRVSVAYFLRPAPDHSMRWMCGTGDVVPAAAANEDEDDDRNFGTWASDRVIQIYNGLHKPQTSERVPVAATPYCHGRDVPHFP